MSGLDAIAALHVGTDTVAGALVQFEPARIERAVVARLEAAQDLSLVIAEVLAGLGRPPLVSIAATFESGQLGPVDGTAEHAQTRADRTGLATTWVNAENHGVVVAAHHVDRITRAAVGAGLTVNRVEAADAATNRATGGGRRIKDVAIPYDLIETSTISSGQLSAMAGTALGLASDAPGNLIGPQAVTAEPSGAGRGGTGWSVARMPAPIDFSRQLESNHQEFHSTMVAFAISFVALIAALLLL
jgi:hypothetical protein